MTKSTSSYNHSRIAQDAREILPCRHKGNWLGRGTDDVDSVCVDDGRVLCAMATSRYFAGFWGQYPIWRSYRKTYCNAKTVIRLTIERKP